MNFRQDLEVFKMSENCFEFSNIFLVLVLYVSLAIHEESFELILLFKI